jgi:hypothetical protein
MPTEKLTRERHRMYIELAKEAEEAAAKAADPQVKQSFERIAAGWKHLAEQLQRMEDFNRWRKPR